MPDPENYTIVLRFMGTTPSTSNIIATFNSIIYQLSRVFNLPAPDKPLIAKLPLRSYLLEQLSLINVLNGGKKKLVIVLDSLDQLTSADYNLEWFLDILPDNVNKIYYLKFSKIIYFGSFIF